MTVLRHGYTLADVYRLARTASHVGKAAMGYGERHDEAWSAIVETLYSAQEPPSDRDLVWAGRSAVYSLMESDLRHRGFADYKNVGAANGVASGLHFREYWGNLAGVTGSHESATVERFAVEQILPRLSPGEVEALAALAATGTYQGAAEVLGLRYTALTVRVSTARRKFLRYWHEGETPSRPWGCDRRVEKAAFPGLAGGGRKPLKSVRRRTGRRT